MDVCVWGGGVVEVGVAMGRRSGRGYGRSEWAE